MTWVPRTALRGRSLSPLEMTLISWWAVKRGERLAKPHVQAQSKHGEGGTFLAAHYPTAQAANASDQQESARANNKICSRNQTRFPPVRCRHAGGSIAWSAALQARVCAVLASLSRPSTACRPFAPRREPRQEPSRRLRAFRLAIPRHGGRRREPCPCGCCGRFWPRSASCSLQ